MSKPVPESLGARGMTPSGKPRLFVCGVCTRAFARQEHLKRHERSHTKEKPFGCGVCQRKFSRRDLLLRHAQKLHAGCDDAIKRLRRRSSRAKKDDENNLQRSTNDGDFNFFFATNSDTHGNLHARHHSFSAASGQSYASAANPAGAGTQVEFATPQLVPTEAQWMEPLPGLGFLSNFSLEETNNGVGQSRGMNVDDSNGGNQRSVSVSTAASGNNRRKRQDGVFGYSFYDDDYTGGQQHSDFSAMRLSYPKLPSTYLNDSASSPTSSSHNNDFVLLSDLEVPNQAEQILSVGYSFYESNDATSANANGLGWRDLREISEADIIIDGDMSHTELFTHQMVERIAKVMERYPFVGLPPPALPAVEYLNHYVDNFRSKFLSHYPFIHKNLLNELAMFQYTLNSDQPKDYSPTVCLPLLIATIGALYTNQKRHAADLYEYSRRCIHVYLDSRKKNDEAEKSTTHNSPLWLVQSLVLSVQYGLFGEYQDSDLPVVLRQVNALCTLIKVSKFNVIEFSHENIEINENYFQDYIVYQSKVRTVFMIFNISSMLTCMYNLEPFIKYKEIKCDLPDLESYWNCSNLEDFKRVCINSHWNYSLNMEKILNDMLFNNQIGYKVSEFGSIIMMYTVLQYFYFNKRNALTNYSVGIAPDHMNSSNLVKNYLWEDMLIDPSREMNMESICLRNITVLRSLMIDLSNVKEAIWNRHWNEVCTEFISTNPRNADLVDACDYSIRTLSMLFLNDIESSNFRKCLSLTLQWVFFNFFYIVKFLHKFERIILKQVMTGGSVKPYEARAMPQNFSMYVKIAKFLADLEQLLTRNFDYSDPVSKLALREFDPSKITFGYQRLVDTSYPSEVNMDNVVKVIQLRLSSNTLKIASFIFGYVYRNEASFNIFENLSDGCNQMRLFLEKDLG